MITKIAKVVDVRNKTVQSIKLCDPYGDTIVDKWYHHMDFVMDYLNVTFESGIYYKFQFNNSGYITKVYNLTGLEVFNLRRDLNK